MSHMFVQKCILLWNSSFHSMAAKSLSFIWTHPQSHPSYQGWAIIDDASFLEVAWLCDTLTTVCLSLQFSSVAQSCLALCDPMNRSMPGFPVHHQLLELAQKLMSTESVMPSHHLILCCPLLLLPLVFPSIRVFSNESALCIMWPEYWSFSFTIRPSNEYLGLISFRIDWFDLLAVQGILKRLLPTTITWKNQLFGRLVWIFIFIQTNDKN